MHPGQGGLETPESKANAVDPFVMIREFPLDPLQMVEQRLIRDIGHIRRQSKKDKRPMDAPQAFLAVGRCDPALHAIRRDLQVPI